MKLRFLLGLLLANLLIAPRLSAYGVLSHEELIDMCWQTDIRPALLKRFPEITEDQIHEAHGYAYGGSVIQDVGYYPFGSHEFTNYLHYLRSGDFVATMLREAGTPDEYAFALGALSHYAADSWGHPAVNEGVPIVYPDLRRKYGPVVTYEDNRNAHLETEFSFDVVQVARKRYVSKQFHDFIGFKVPEDFLRRAFFDTYGINSNKMLKHDGLAIGSYRFGISRVIPEMTQVAIASRKINMPEEKNDAARQQFLYHLSRAQYDNDFGTNYRHPGAFARFLGFLLHHLIPRRGPFRALSFKDPTSQSEDLYFKSMDNVVTNYHRLVKQVSDGDFDIPNRNLDTGDPTRAGKYFMADEAYDDLVRRLAKNHFKDATPELRASLLTYFNSGSSRDKLGWHKWRETRKAIAKLKKLKETPQQK